MDDDQWFVTFSNFLDCPTTKFSKNLDIAASEDYLQDKEGKLKEFARHLEKREEILEELYTELDRSNERLESYELVKTSLQELKIPLTSWSPNSYISR